MPSSSPFAGKYSIARLDSNPLVIQQLIGKSDGNNSMQRVYDFKPINESFCSLDD